MRRTERMDKVKLLLIVAMLVNLDIQAVAQNKLIDLSLQTKFYPAGSIYGIRLERQAGAANTVALMAGYNVLYHGDLGEHENEWGGGPGISFSYRHYKGENYTGWFYGAMLDLYYNHVKFEDNKNTPQEIRGSHDVFVIQPLAEIGYMIPLKNKPYRFGPYLSFGWEINTAYANAKSPNPSDISDPKSGEGSIIILGFTFGKVLGSR